MENKKECCPKIPEGETVKGLKKLLKKSDEDYEELVVESRDEKDMLKLIASSHYCDKTKIRLIRKYLI